MPSMGSHRVGHNWGDLAAAAAAVSSNCCFLTCIQVSQETGKVIWYSHPLKNFPQFVVIHTVKFFSTVNEAEADVFLEVPCFLHDPTNVGSLIPGSAALSKLSLHIWKLSVHILLKTSSKNFEHNHTSIWNEPNCIVAWTLFGISLLWHWSESWSLSSPVITA